MRTCPNLLPRLAHRGVGLHRAKRLISWFGFRLTDEALVLVRQNLPQLESLDLTGCDAISDEAKLSLWDARGGGPLQILW